MTSKEQTPFRHAIAFLLLLFSTNCFSQKPLGDTVVTIRDNPYTFAITYIGTASKPFDGKKLFTQKDIKIAKDAAKYAQHSYLLAVAGNGSKPSLVIDTTGNLIITDSLAAIQNLLLLINEFKRH